MKTEAEIREKLAILGRDRLFLRGCKHIFSTKSTKGQQKLL